jgi:glycosyltransferase involved in cell wall biosynthesis
LEPNNLYDRKTRRPAERKFTPMQLIFINRFFHPDESATSQILSDLAFALAEKGHEVHVVASRQSYDAPRQTLAQRERVRGVEVHRVWTTYFGRGSLLGRLFDYLSFWVSAGVTLLRLTRAGDVIIAKTDPPLLSVLAAPIARWRRARLINWLQDIYPETAEALGLGRGYLSRALHGALRALRDRSLEASAMNVVLGERMAEFLAKRGIPADQVRIVPNFADGNLNEMPERAGNALRRSWEMDGKFVVGYSGNLGRAHDHATLLDAICRIETAQRAAGESERPIAFLFIGGGAGYDKLRRDLDARGLTSTRFEPYQPREHLSESLAAADVHLVTLRPELEGLIVPSKFYGITAVGRPTIFVGAQDGEIARLIARYDCGRTVPVGDGASLAQTIRELAAARPLCEAMGQRARQAFETAFDKKTAVARWETLLADITGHSAGRPQEDVVARPGPRLSARKAL